MSRNNRLRPVVVPGWMAELFDRLAETQGDTMPVDTDEGRRRYRYTGAQGAPDEHGIRVRLYEDVTDEEGGDHGG